MVPVHLVVRDLGVSGAVPKLDRVFKTWNFARGAERGVSRTIGAVALPPGRYRVTATTLRDTAMPANLATRLDLTYPPKK
jgi:hypothetical protein